MIPTYDNLTFHILLPNLVLKNKQSQPNNSARILW